MTKNDPLSNFADQYRQSKIDPVQQLIARLDLLETRMDQIEAAQQNLKSELALFRHSVPEMLAEHDQADDAQEIKSLIGALRDKLRHLQRQEARYSSADLPVHIALELERTEKRIVELQQELSSL